MKTNIIKLLILPHSQASFYVSSVKSKYSLQHYFQISSVCVLSLHSVIGIYMKKCTKMYYSFINYFVVAWNLVIFLEMGMLLLNLLASKVSCNCHTVWCLRCWTVGIADGLSWPLSCSLHLNCGLLHITLGFNSGTKEIQCHLILISNLGGESMCNADEWVALVIFVNGLIQDTKFQTHTKEQVK